LILGLALRLWYQAGSADDPPFEARGVSAKSGVTVGVDRILSAVDELPAVAFDESPLLSRSDSVDQVHPPVVGPLNLAQLKPTTSLRRREERLPFAGDQRMNG
jgi:hypothetical protein